MRPSEESPIVRQRGDDPPEVKGVVAECVPAGEIPPTQRRPYRKPEFVFERAFETLALSCGKISDSSALCHMNRKFS